MTEPMRLRARAKAPAKNVMHALTDAGELRVWLAEHAEVALPDTYAFWGRYTPAGDVPRQRPLHADESSLRFAWIIDGTETVVDLSLTEESPDSTIITLTQTNVPGYQEILTGSGPLVMMSTFWSLAIANLIDHVEGRALTPKPDLTSPEMREQILIGAPPREVFDSILDAETFSRWFGARVEVEPYVGGRWSMGGFENDPQPAKIVDLDPGRRFTIEFDGGLVASWELEESDGKTRLTFVQSGFDADNPPYDSWLGWLSGLAELRRFHELADWRPVWVEVSLEGMPEGLITTGQEE